MASEQVSTGGHPCAPRYRRRIVPGRGVGISIDRVAKCLEPAGKEKLRHFLDLGIHACLQVVRE